MAGIPLPRMDLDLSCGDLARTASHRSLGSAATAGQFPNPCRWARKGRLTYWEAPVCRWRVPPASFRSLGRMVSAGRHARRGQCGFDRFLAEAHVQQALDAIGPRWGRGFRNSTLGPDHAVSVGVVAREFHQVEGVGVPVRLARLALAESRRHNRRGDHGGRRRRSLPSNKGMIYES